MQRMRSVSTKNTTLPLWSSIVCNLGRGTEQPDLAIVAQHTLHVNLTVRISSLLPNWAAPNGGEGGIGFATLRAFAPSLRLSVPLRCTNPLLGFASHPSYLIGLRPMAEREGLVSLRSGLSPPACGCPFRCAAQTLCSGSHLIPLT